MDNLSKNEQERTARRSAARKRLIKKLLIWLVVLLVGAGFIYWAVDYSKKAEKKKPGAAIEELGREHIPVESPRPEYNSNPPTSGLHYPVPAEWGIYDELLPDEQLVHNLEHGGIWISYKNPEDQELVNQLKDLAGEYTLKVILTPRPANDAPIAVAAWGRLLELDVFDEEQIKDFIGAFINRGPEQVPF